MTTGQLVKSGPRPADRESARVPNERLTHLATEQVGSGGDALPDILALPIGGLTMSEEQASRAPRDQLLEELGILRARYRALAERLPAIVYINRADDLGTNLYVSPQTEEILGVSAPEWTTNPEVRMGMLHPDDRDRVVRERHKSNETGKDFASRYQLRRPDGRLVWIRDHAVLIRDAGGAPLYWQGAMLDVSEVHDAQRELSETQAKYKALAEDIPAIVYIDEIDDAMSTSLVSPQIQHLLGISPEEYIADPDLWYHCLHPDDRERALGEYLRGRDSGESFAFEYRLIARDGRVVWFRDSAVVIRDEQGKPIQVQGVMLDMTDRKEAEERAAFLAYHDKLTGLPNRALFEELLELAIARARRHEASVAVVYADLDDFKLVNDSLGHDAGDELLRQLAGRLGEATRETDLVARQGGDEFLLLLADLERAGDAASGMGDTATMVAEGVASRVQEALAEPFCLGGTEVYVSASVGVSLFPHHADEAGTLLMHADHAMYRSKRSGPGGYAIHADDESDALTKLSLTTRLRKAVENQNWELHYQPIVDLADRTMVGVEALIRWPEPGGGLIPPGEFIPLAEEMGLIETIGDWVVEEVCRQDVAWRAEGLDAEISFNLSPRQLWQPDLGDKIMSRIAAAGVDVGNVVVEITESTAMIDPDRTQRILTDLHGQGLRLAIDDFGTGYSSLSRLKHLPVDILKIDRTFIRDVDKDRSAGSMVSAIIALAMSLGMTPLAEGIETEEEWRFLQDHGCPLGQGYYFCKPARASEITARYRRSGMHLIEQAG
jgi:diguanylate cyclase (GGDEF)-like protein/PAS domain S-box-containing protein